MAYNIIPQRGVFSTIANLINENFQRIYQQILGLDGSGEQAAEDISQLESDVSALQSGKANDADVVHKAGAETITGNKTFTGTVVLTLQNSGILVIDENGVVKSDSIVIVNDVTYEAGDNIFYLKKTVNGSKSNIVQVEVTPNSNSTGLVTSGGIYTALAHKVDKVQSTDNAVVRFDGASGAVQNSGVTINDSNHLTAAKFITSGGTSSQVVLGNGTLIAADILPQYEAYLKWGGKSISNGYSPIDASMIGELGANRLAFPNAGGITVEYSRDSGTTWTDYQASDDKKVGLFSGIQQNFAIGKAASNDVASNTYQLRIKIVAGSGSSAVGVYTQLNKFAFLVSTSGSTGCWCTIKGRKTEDYNDNTETYKTYADQVAIGGWSGYNIINTSSITFSAGNTQTKEIIFTFGCDGYNGNGTTHTGLQIYKVFCFGGVGWTEPSNMARHDHLYYWDSIQNMITPAGVYPKISSTYNLGSTSFFWKEVYANKFVTKNGTSSQFVKGDGTLDSTSYAPLASPALTGTPTAPTAAAGTNTTQIATTAFVKSAADDLSETLTDGTAASESGNVIDIGNYDIMKMNEVRGKSLVMNQLIQNGNFADATGWSLSASNYGTITTNNNTATVTLTQVPSNRYTPALRRNGVNIVQNHYYLCKAEVYSTISTSWRMEIGGDGWGTSSDNLDANKWNRFAFILKRRDTPSSLFFPIYPNYNIDNWQVGNTWSVRNVQCIDLTQMFGAGNEPTTVEKFRQICSLNQYMHNTGEVVGNNVEKLDVTGFNIWDEEWEVGNINANGTNSAASDRIRSKNYIPVLPNTTYFFKLPISANLRVVEFDSSKTVIGLIHDTAVSSKTLALSVNAAYIRFVFGNSITPITTYNHDICINKSNTSKNGTYEPYKHSEFLLNLTELTGKVNGEGTSVTIFPDGLHGVGTAYDSLIVDDDGYARRAVKRMGSRAYASGDESDTSVITDNTNTYYPLATPIEYVLDTPVQCVVKVYPNGTVKQVPVMPDSTPMIMDVTYLHDTGGVIGGLVNKLASLEPRIDDLAKGIKTISVQYGDAANIVLETEKINGNEGTVSIPAATSQAAGAMSAAQAALLEDLSDLADDIETLLASI